MCLLIPHILLPCRNLVAYMTPSAAPPTTVWSEMQLLCFVAADVALSLEGTPLSISQPQTFLISRFVGSTDEVGVWHANIREHSAGRSW